VVEGSTELVASDAWLDGPNAIADESDAVAFGRESGVDATDSFRFRAGSKPVATGAESGGSRTGIVAADAHPNSTAPLSATPI
jgi:hypothetical protein